MGSFDGESVGQAPLRHVKIIHKRLLAVNDEAAELDGLDGEKCPTKNDAPDHDDDKIDSA